MRFFNLGLGLTGTTAALQRLDASSWRTVFTSPALGPERLAGRVPACTFQAEGAAASRALLVSEGKTIATSPTRTLVYKREATRVSVPVFYLDYGMKFLGTTGGRVAAGTQFSQTYRLDSAFSDRTG